MAIRYYDDILAEKLKRWIPENSTLRVLKPDETKRLWETKADDNADSKFKLPFIGLSRDSNIELLSNIKQAKSFDGLRLLSGDDKTLQMNVIPIKVNYQLDIYTKTEDEGDEYLRNFLFKLINNPTMVITIPYSNSYLQHIVNIRVESSVADTSEISQRLFSGQFTRWTIKLELQDAFLFNLPYRQNWKLDGVAFEVFEHEEDLTASEYKVQQGLVEAEIEPIDKDLECNCEIS